jgi:sec-independent protein translocase protein TatA
MFSSAFLAIMGMGPTELIVILVILLILFGGSKLPGLAKGLGQSIKEFKKASKEEEQPEPAKPAATVEVKKPESPTARPTTS